MERIGAGLVEHEPRRERPHVLERRCQVREIGLVPGAVVEPDVEVARFLRHRVVALLVHAQREHAVVSLEDARGAVPLVHLQVHDREALGETF